MMPTSAVQVAVGNAVQAMIAAQVTAGELSQTFVPRRSYGDWDLDLAKLDKLELRDRDKLHVDIVVHMTKQSVDASTRGGKLRYKVPCDICVRRKFGEDKQSDDTGRIDLAAIDDLVLLTQELHLMFMQHRLTTFDYAVWDGEGGGTQLVWSPNGDHLRDWRQFTGLVRVFFRVDV